METNLIQNDKRSTILFVLGILAFVATVVLFIIGYPAVGGISIATLCVGGLAMVHFLIACHARNGWVRMFSALFLATLSVLITITALAL